MSGMDFQTCGRKIKKMPKFEMERNYESRVTLKTNDILVAIKMNSNYEGDLYVDGQLAMSCLGLPMEENAIKLMKYGITAYVKNDRWRYKYTDESKNVKRYYVSPYAYKWDGVEKIQYNIHDYPTDKDVEEFESLKAVFKNVRDYTELLSYDPEDVHVVIWDDIWGCHTFSHTDWKKDEEPVRHHLYYGDETHSNWSGTKDACEKLISRLTKLSPNIYKEPKLFSIIPHENLPNKK